MQRFIVYSIIYTYQFALNVSDIEMGIIVYGQHALAWMKCVMVLRP